MLKRLAGLLFLTTALLSTPVLAGTAGDVTRDALYNGPLQAGFDGLADMDDQEAKFGKGFLTFARAVEGFAQALYRHGLVAPNAGPMAPILSVPVPPNANPEPLDYQKVRTILSDLVTGLDAAAVLLLEAGESGDYVVKLDVMKFRIDINGDGDAAETETLGNVFAQIDPQFAGQPQIPTDVPDGGGLKHDKSLGTKPALPVEPAQPGIGFDRADAIWLAGYSNIIAAQADFLLAHDFSDFVNAAFHRFFPHAGLPMQEFSKGGSLMLDPETDNAIADVIAAIHTINWPVTEPARLKHVLERFSTVTALSRKNWEAILAETDDNAELVPNPRQTPMLPEGKVTDETIAAWHATLDTTDEILAGKLLVPHWRFKQGFDLKAYFETAKRTDFVMILSGYGAIPFLRDGPIATADSFAEGNRVFGDQFMGYAFWFN